MNGETDERMLHMIDDLRKQIIDHGLWVDVAARAPEGAEQPVDKRPTATLVVAHLHRIGSELAMLNQNLAALVATQDPVVEQTQPQFREPVQPAPPGTGG